MPEVILYSGSFNPIHNGHTAVALYVAEAGLCDELWITVSPRNPLKSDADLAPDSDRLEMTRIAVREKVNADNIKVCDVEFELPRPSYTIDTLKYLSGRYPDTRFSLLVGTDILPGLHKWKDWQFIVNNCRIYVYPRKGENFVQLGAGMIFLSDAPQIDISSTDIRVGLEKGADLSGMLSRGVITYIYDKGLWVSDPATRRLEALNKVVVLGKAKTEDYLERGKLLYRRSDFGPALNDFIHAQEADPTNSEAKEYIRLLNAIFEYRNMDIYNP